MAFIPVNSAASMAGAQGAQASQGTFTPESLLERRRQLALLLSQQGQEPADSALGVGARLAQTLAGKFQERGIRKKEEQNVEIRERSLAEAMASQDPNVAAMILGRSRDPQLQQFGAERSFALGDETRSAEREAAIRAEQQRAREAEREDVQAFQAGQGAISREFEAEQNRLAREAKNPAIDFSGLGGGAPGGETSGITLWDAVPQAVGLGNTINEVSNRTLTQIPGVGGMFFDDKTAQARSAFKLVERDLIRAFSINPRFPVAEQNRILNLVPQANLFESTPNSRAALKEIDIALGRQVQDDMRLLQSGAISGQDASDLVQRVGLIASIRKQIGVPESADVKEGPKPAAPAEAVQMLKSDPSPEAMREFDEIFGSGAAHRALGQ